MLTLESRFLSGNVRRCSVYQNLAKLLNKRQEVGVNCWNLINHTCKISNRETTTQPEVKLYPNQPPKAELGTAHTKIGMDLNPYPVYRDSNPCPLGPIGDLFSGLATKLAKLDLIKIQRLFGESDSLGSGLFQESESSEVLELKTVLRSFYFSWLAWEKVSRRQWRLWACFIL